MLVAFHLSGAIIKVAVFSFDIGLELHHVSIF
jgi:hypothetical protein